MKKSELKQIIKEEIIKEIKSNTSKTFNWFWSIPWDPSSAKDLQRKIREMSDEDLILLLNNEPIPSKLNNPRKIQIALLHKEIKRRGLKIS